MRYAVAIAEEQSFTRAAERCFVVQSALSRQIKSLESELGVTLFARTSRKVEVTPAGEAFVKQARLCLQAAERAKVAAAAAHGEIRGSLTIGVIPTVTAVDVAAVLGAFRHNHPEVSVHVRTGEQSDLAFDRAGLRREVSFEVNTAELLTGLVRQGLGAALVAPSVAREVPGCACIPVSDGPVRVEYLAWDSFNPSPAAQAFVDSVPVPQPRSPSLTATTT